MALYWYLVKVVAVDGLGSLPQYGWDVRAWLVSSPSHCGVSGYGRNVFGGLSPNNTAPLSDAGWLPPTTMQGRATDTRKERERRGLTVSLQQTEARCSVDRTNKAHAQWRTRGAAYA